MHIFPAELADLNTCCQISGAYVTDYVWQMQTHKTGHRTDIRFDTIRLPRSMQVEYPRSPDELLDHWKRDGCFLVVSQADDEIIGFIDAQPQPEQNFLWIHNLVIDKRFRQRGAGSLLLDSARKWATQHHLRKLMLEVQTKNFPAISFAQKHGFQFCGYNERYYVNGDIALFFYLPL